MGNAGRDLSDGLELLRLVQLLFGYLAFRDIFRGSYHARNTVLWVFNLKCTGPDPTVLAIRTQDAIFERPPVRNIGEKIVNARPVRGMDRIHPGMRIFIETLTRPAPYFFVARAHVMQRLPTD